MINEVDKRAMHNLLRDGDIIRKIRDNENLEGILSLVKALLYEKGPCDERVLEIISYIKLFNPDFFQEFEQDIIEIMGLFFKRPKTNSLIGSVFELYRQNIENNFNENYTPMQANIIEKINGLQYFSFSAPTSTGKSFVFRHLVLTSSNDVVVVVPSRALINEYYDRLISIVDSKTVNILTFVDRVNTKYARRNIFILTPERARDLFKNKEWLRIDIVLFDEAQLSDEASIRGLYFDSIVRRVLKNFPTAKCVFSHPFIDNPEAQFQKNGILIGASASYSKYELKNVGKIFYVHDDIIGKFYHFGVDPKTFGRNKIEAGFDPVERALRQGGSVLIYVPKRRIFNGGIYSKFSKYISMCPEIIDESALDIINKLKDYIGASDDNGFYCNSTLIEKLTHGIVIHHGSLPLRARLLLEHFTQMGFCKICFATSTLEQGINMPFDVVYLDRLEGSKVLSVKNLIGRAGRSTTEPVFDYGSVVLQKNAMSRFRKIFQQSNRLSVVSCLDKEGDSIDQKYDEFRRAINTGEFSDEFNLTNGDLKKLDSNEVVFVIPKLLDLLFDENDSFSQIPNLGQVCAYFCEIYSYYLGRDLTRSERSVFDSAIRILMLRFSGKTFGQICRYRFAYASQIARRRMLENAGRKKEADNLKAKFIVGYGDIPDKKFRSRYLFSSDRAKDVDYDRIVYDTYDYLDKLIGFRLSDLFYATFRRYFDAHNFDERAERLATLIKYGTEDPKEIWLLRYGFSFEDIEWLKPCVQRISQQEIVFNEKINDLDSDKFKLISRFRF